MPNRQNARLLFVSCNEANWGGSEELWARTAVTLAERGVPVFVAKANVWRDQPVLQQLKRCRVHLHDLANFPLLPRSLQRKLLPLMRNVNRCWQALRLAIAILITRPRLVVLNQGANWDGFLYAAVLRKMRQDYVLISHKASEFNWPSDWMRPYCKQLYRGAHRCYFVSEQTRRLTEFQLGLRLPEAAIVRNPFLTDWHQPLPWPSGHGKMQLACVARFHPNEKGQDLLLRVLAMEKWRNRQLHVTFFGEGDGALAVEEMAALLGLENVSFPGFTEDVITIWRTHHALILPSRAEGLPLAVVEAMLAGRVPIVTDVGGNLELCAEGENAFVAPNATIEAVDEALERAWDARDRWPAIGLAASAHAKSIVPAEPAAVFADELLRMTELAANRRRTRNLAAA